MTPAHRVICLLAALLRLLIGGTAAEAQQPNILVILADDLGYGDVGFNGCVDIPTPNIDTLATQGIVFANGYVSHSVCSPSRAGLLSGRYQQRFGYEANPTNAVVNTLPANQITVAQVLTNAGYRSIIVGKWHLGGNNPNQPPNRGFSDFFGFLGGGSGSYFLTTNDFLRRGLTNVVETNYLTFAFTREAISYIGTSVSNAKPFFLYLAYNAPHVPLEAPQDYLDKFASITETTRQTYAAMVSALDDGIGEVLQSLDDNNIATNTLVFFLSDNGGPTDATSADNSPLRGHKGQIFEGGVHVPFVMRWTGRLPAGTTYTSSVSALDIFATSVALAGGAGPTDRPMDTVDLMPYLLGQTNGFPHDYLYWRDGGGASWAVRDTNGWKWLQEDSESVTALYHLAVDGTGEDTDQAGVETSRVVELENAISAWDAEMLEPTFGPGEIEKLNGALASADNLGYLITTTNAARAYALVTPRHPPDTASNFVIRFRMYVSGAVQNGYVVLGETNATGSLILAGINRDQSKLVITENETGGSNTLTLGAADLPVGTNEYELAYDRPGNTLTLTLGTNSVTRTLSRLYGRFAYPGYAVQNASTRFSVLQITQTVADVSSPTYEWDAGAGADRTWANKTNWTGNLEPTSLNTAYVNGGYTGVVSSSGRRALALYVGSTNMPSNGANSTGRVEQIGGDLVIGNNLYLGNGAEGAGSYIITNGSLVVSNVLYVGNQGLGTMTVTNTASVTAAFLLVVGNAGPGAETPGSRLTVGGGTVTVGDQLQLGGNASTNSAADGEFDQYGGIVNVGNTIKVADDNNSTGRMTVAGGVLNLGLNLILGDNPNTRADVGVSGVSTVSIGGDLRVCDATPCVANLTLSGGLLTVQGSNAIGGVAGSTGSVAVSAGSWRAPGGIVVGLQGEGSITVSGGAITASTFTASYAPNGIGTLNVSGGRLVTTNLGESLTLRRPGALMSITGGTVEANGVFVGALSAHNTAPGPVVLNLAGGTLLGGRDNNAAISNDFYIGAATRATGVVNVIGGTLDLTRANNDLILGRGTNALGILTLDGGTVSVGGALRVGALTAGDYELTGNGQIYVTNGLLSVRNMNLPISAGATAAVVQVGGTVAAAGTVSLGVSGGGGAGRYVISGGALTITNGGSLTIGHATNGMGYFEVVGGAPSISVGSNLTSTSHGELRCSFNGSSLAPIYAGGALEVDGTLSVTNTGAPASGMYLVATSLNGTAVSGTFATTNWLGGVTGTVSYANNRIVITFEGTDTFVAGSTNTSINVTAGSATVGFTTISGLLYRVQSTTNLLDPGGWKDLTTVLTNRVGENLIFIDTNVPLPDLNAYRIRSP